MAEHEIRIGQLPEVEIINKDLRITVYSDGQTFGTLTVSRGGIGWLPKGPSKERHLEWEEFDRRVRSKHRRPLRRKSAK